MLQYKYILYLLSFCLLILSSESLHASTYRTTYYGALDNVYPFTMELERDQNNIEGHYTFIGCAEKFILSGTIEDNVYILLEFDSSGLNTASMELSLKARK